ncbi:efflux RND transporter permease subunit [Pedococcus ginsenosidimutans]|uniref:Efflux RND transporter permease subunit n=2 Tax=Pedococcus ginsenosidimutans TaxID=490570 RepID=A0ABP8YL82_9MICO
MVFGANPRVGRLSIAAAVGVLIMGISSMGSARTDFLPEFMPPSVQVQTEALGLSAAEVEQLITVPLEQDLLNGVPWLDRIHSRSQPGLSAIDIVFEQGTDIYSARQMVQERLTQAHALPAVGTPPIMVEPLASVSRVAMIGMTSRTVSLIDMSVLARWKVRPRLMGIPGVANVAIYGQRDRQLQVRVDPQRLHDSDVSLTQVIETTGNALWVSPLTFVEASTPGTGGFIEGTNQRLAVQHVLPITTAESLGKISIEDARTPTRLGDVTEVVEDHQPLIGDAVDADPSLFLVIQKFPDADTQEVTKAVEEAMSGLQAGLGGITVDTSVFRPASFIDSARHTVGWALGAGFAAVVMAVLFLFWSWRAALVVASSVAVSAVAAVYVLYLRGTTLTSMTLAGLVVALVVILAVAVTDIEEAQRRLAGRHDDGSPVPLREALTDAIAHSQGAALIVVLAAALAIAPVMVLGPLTTALAGPVATTLLLTLALSVAVGLLVTPALMTLVLRPGAGGTTGPLLRWAHRPVSGLVNRFASGRRLVWGTVAVLLLAGLAAVPQIVGSHDSMIPAARDLDLLMHVETAQGTSLTEATRVAGRLSADLRSLPGVRAVGGHFGRALTSDQLGDVNSGELWITISDDADYHATREAIDRTASRYAGVKTQLVTYSADRVAAARTGTGADLVVRLFGQDPAGLDEAARAVVTSLTSVEGVRAPRVEEVPKQPTVKVQVDLAAAERYGLRPGDVRREATTLASGLTVGNLYEQAKVFDVVVLGTPTIRANLSALADLKIDTSSGRQVRLGDVAKLTVEPEPASIEHEQVMRTMDVVADISGRGVGDTLADVRAAAAKVPMPPEAHLQVLSAAMDQQVDVRRAVALALAALLAMLLVFQAAVGGWRQAALLVLACPLGGVGAVLVAPLVGGVATAGPLLGFFAASLLTLLGGLSFVRSAPPTDRSVGTLARTAVTRVNPVLRLSAVVALAFLPAAVLGGRPGAELLQPFALTLIAGSITSGLVVLLVLPALLGLPPAAAPLTPTGPSPLAVIPKGAQK